MIHWYNLFLFLITVLGGSFPLWFSDWTEKQMKYLLAFSGAYLLGVSMIHLIPEAVIELGTIAGIMMLFGFFIQQVLQRFTHGVEHGHAHIGHHHGHFPTVTLFFGMAIHAFTEGIPLGAAYHDTNTVPALYLAIALHKLPEAMLITSLLHHNGKSKAQSAIWLIGFALLTPLSSTITSIVGEEVENVARYIPYATAFVMGSFIHIATTIFFESGTKSHEMSWRKWLVVGLGIALALFTMLNVSHTGHGHVH